MTRILVTGGSGFIGKHLALALIASHTLTTMSGSPGTCSAASCAAFSAVEGRKEVEASVMRSLCQHRGDSARCGA